MMNSKETIKLARDLENIFSDLEVLRESFEDIELIANDLASSANRGNVILSGVGKSGLLASKFSGSLRSLGVKSVFLHSSDAAHGDLGLLRQEDWVILVSDSGNSRELIPVARRAKDIGARLSAVVGKEGGVLSRYVDDVFQIRTPSFEKNQVPVPIRSNIVFGVFFELICSAFIRFGKLGVKSFAENHPGGHIGHLYKKTVADVMLPIEQVGRVSSSADAALCAGALTEFPVGVILVEDENSREHDRLGVITDGDLRRFVMKQGVHLQTSAKDLATWSPLVLQASDNLSKALDDMKSHKPLPCNVAPVEANGSLIGVLNLQQITDWVER